jgi:hypothetical protein
MRLFRSSIPCLPVPLSTLRWPPRGWPRMTRGQDGSLLLSCVTLSFTTPRRFIPAHTTDCWGLVHATAPIRLRGARGEFILPNEPDGIPPFGRSRIRSKSVAPTSPPTTRTLLRIRASRLSVALVTLYNPIPANDSANSGRPRDDVTKTTRDSPEENRLQSTSST